MFTTALQLEKLGRKTWKVLSPLVWHNSAKNAAFRDITITVPINFITDLASIPNWLQGLPYLQVNSRSTSPAVLHDYLYVNQALDYEEQGVKYNVLIKRKAADKLLRESLIAENEHKFVAWVYYISVRIFGRFGWNRNKKKLNENKNS